MKLQYSVVPYVIVRIITGVVLVLSLTSPVLFKGLPIAAASNESNELRTNFIGTVSLQELSAGAAGDGTILYYQAHATSDHPSLIVRLSKRPGADTALAEVYDAPLGQTHIPIALQENSVALDPLLRPTISIKAIGGWWVRNGHVNYNLDIQINGPIDAMWGAAYDPQSGSNGWQGFIKSGEPAVAIQVRDPDQEGIPKWDLRLLIPTFSNRGYYRTNYAERKCKTPLDFDLGISPLWPFVSASASDGYAQEVGRLRPPIVVDWQQGRITYFSELVTVRNQNCSYSLYSLNKLVVGEMNKLDFETPFAFYDLSGQGRGYPNLILRTERYPLSDPWAVSSEHDSRNRQFPKDLETVRYSWRNDIGDRTWDYKIEVLGFYPYTSTTPIAGGLATSDAPAYDQFPRWVVEHSWPAVTFIDTENNSYQSTEGIYDWWPRDLGLEYVLGWKDRPYPDAFSNISPGLRGEYRLLKNAPPSLYLSPIDNRLHLLGAEGGLWDLSKRVILQPRYAAIPTPTPTFGITSTVQLVLREHNIDGGPYINGWTLENILRPNVPNSTQVLSDKVDAALYALHGYLIYAGPQGVELRRANYQLASFELLPPTDNATWQTFRNQVVPYTRERRDPADLQSWLAQFPGQTFVISGAQITDIHALADGFRFVLDLPHGFHVQNGDPSLFFNVSALAPGRYVVTYDKQFHIEPLIPPRLSAVISPATVTDLEPARLQILIQNKSNQDIAQVGVELWAAPGRATSRIVATDTMELLTTGSIASELKWTPPIAGAWTFTATLRLADGSGINSPPANITVAPAQPADPESILDETALVSVGPFVLLIVVAFIAVAGITAWHQLRDLHREQDNAQGR